MPNEPVEIVGEIKLALVVIEEFCKTDWFEQTKLESAFMCLDRRYQGG